MRVRDQQAAHARQVAPAPFVAPSPVDRPSRPRVVRPKPPRDEDADHLLRLGADVNDRADGGSTVLDRCLCSFGWKEAVLDAWYSNTLVPMSSLGPSLEALQCLLDRGARWTPDDRSITETRRALYRVEGRSWRGTAISARRGGTCT